MKKRKYPGIKQRVTSEGPRWRACYKLQGKQHVGPWRDNQEAASDDYRALRARLGDAPAEDLTLGQAFERCCFEARKRGVSEYVVQSTYESVHRRLLRSFEAKAAMRDIDVGHVKTYIREQLAAGIHPNTLLDKDLQKLSQAFQVARLPSPVSALSKQERPKRVRTQMTFFTAAEAAAIIDDIRRKPLLDDSGRKLSPREREHDADLLEFMLHSGIRPHEFGRVLLSDVSIAQKKIAVREPKVREWPREVHITAELLPVVERLFAHAVAAGRDNLTGINERNLAANVVRRWKKRLGEPRLTGRALRHTAITLALQSGATLIEAKQFAGHKHVTTTDLYVHALEDKDGTVAGNISKLLKLPSAAPKEVA